MDFYSEIHGSPVLPGGANAQVTVCCWGSLPAVGREDLVHCVGKFGPQARDAVLTKVKDSVSFESFMDLRNSPLSRSGMGNFLSTQGHIIKFPNDQGPHDDMCGICMRRNTNCALYTDFSHSIFLLVLELKVYITLPLFIIS